ncbi:hypothetical protein SVAN01_02413 [Stagonosporopsis vannaccii]|nr:hypothetical protein SVAN01_02413 [Stagonosporopsis vannaccii]
MRRVLLANQRGPQHAGGYVTLPRPSVGNGAREPSPDRHCWYRRHVAVRFSGRVGLSGIIGERSLTPKFKSPLSPAGPNDYQPQPYLDLAVGQQRSPQIALRYPGF